MGKGKRILVVDDDLGILESFDVLLGDEHQMVNAQNGYEALTRLGEQSYELIFLDLKMPGLDDIDVLRRIRSQDNRTPVVIITALPQEEYEQEARQLGIDAYVRKPFDVTEVQRIVDSA